MMVNKDLCTGCRACEVVCPVKAIAMVKNGEGFLYPTINLDKCIDCGACEKVCPYINVPQAKSEKVYAVKNNDESIRNASSSGGVFYLLAKEVLKKDGVVYGAAFDKELNLVHQSTENADIRKLMQSKYLQSNTGDTFVKVRNELKEGRFVLYAGTPCQVNGLKNYIGKNYDNLLLVDFVCHGVPSPKVFSKYIKEWEEKEKAKVVDVKFRDKATGWSSFSLKIVFDDGRERLVRMNKDVYMQLFLKNIDLRASCYHCMAKGENRASDITLADFWGGNKRYPDFVDDTGTTLVFVNSDKGEKTFNAIKDDVCYIEVDKTYCIDNNINYLESCKDNAKRDKFFEKLDKYSLDKLNRKYNMPNIMSRANHKMIYLAKRLVKRFVKIAK